jgi:hypothetical protein
MSAKAGAEHMERYGTTARQFELIAAKNVRTRRGRQADRVG